MRTATTFSSGFVTCLAMLSLACGGGGGDSYGADGMVLPAPLALPSPASATECGETEFVSYEYVSPGVGGYRCLKTAESASGSPA